MFQNIQHKSTLLCNNTQVLPQRCTINNTFPYSLKKIQQIMSTYNNAISLCNPMASSTMNFTNLSNNSYENVSVQAKKFIPNRQLTEISSSDNPKILAPRNMLTQSVIYSPNSQIKPKFGGLGKLDSLARHINTAKNEDFPSQKHNSVDKAPFNRMPFPSKESNPFASQIMFPQAATNTSNGEGEKKTHTEPSEMGMRRRRESVDFETMARKGEQNLEKFKFWQRSQPFQPISSNQSQALQKNDCESTNSGSGPEILKPKNFDFLKKKKQMKQDQDAASSMMTQSLRTFNPLKKSEQMWPLSISPIEQKMQKTFDFSQPSSASKAQNKHHPLQQNLNTHSTIQFKKKKLFESSPSPKLHHPPTPPSHNLPRPSISPSQQLNNADPLTKFNLTKVANSDNKTPEKQEIPFFKSKAKKTKKEVTIDDFDILNKLGKGSFGEVFVAQQKNLGLICVIKKMSKKRIKEAKVQEHIIREIKLQSYLNHSHITSLYGYFHDEEYLYLILELLPDGSLQQVKKKKKLPEKEAADILRQVAIGLKFMHQEYVIHRDLKPENLFLNEGYVKIGDLGCSIYHNQAGLRNTIVGCLQYSSPEQLSKEGYTDKIDSWSMGIMAYELLFGKSPFESDIKKMVLNGQGNTDFSEVNFPSAPPITDLAKEFILNLLDKDPDRRMDMDQILHHSFLKQQK